MLFNKKIEPHCAYCARAKKLNDNYMSCLKYGVVSASYHCRKFIYDPTKRVPPRRKTLDKEIMDNLDFSLDD